MVAAATLQIRRMFCITIVCNVCLSLLKVGWGRKTQSIGMQADGLHEFLDAISSVIAWIAVEMTSRHPDAGHPYGHSKYETIASLCISIFLFSTCYVILTDSVLRLQTSRPPEVTPPSFIIMFVSMVIKAGLSRWEKQQGRLYKREVLIADGLHTQSDIFASASVILGLIATKAGFPVMDPIAGVLIAGIIGKTGWQILSESVRVLTDSSRIHPEAIEKLVMGIQGVEACHKIRTRGNMGHVYADLHIHVAPEMSVASAHVIAHQAEETIIRQFPEVKEVVVHVEPHLQTLEND